MQACPLSEILLCHLRSFAITWYMRGVCFSMSSKQMNVNCISSWIKSERVVWEWELFTYCIQWFPRKCIQWFWEITILITLHHLWIANEPSALVTQWVKAIKCPFFEIRFPLWTYKTGIKLKIRDLVCGSPTSFSNVKLCHP